MGTTGTEDADTRLFARSWRLSSDGHLDPSALRDLVDVLVPALEALEGYRGGTLLLDRDTGDLVGTTFWDSLEHLEAGHTRSRNAAAGALVLTEGASMEVSVCEVMLINPPPRHRAGMLGEAES